MEKLQSQIDKVDAGMSNGLEKLDEKIQKLDEKIEEELDERIEELDEKIGDIIREQRRGVPYSN